MHAGFIQYLAAKYPTIKSQFPGEGRRRWHLRVAQEFWSTRSKPELSTANPTSTTIPADDFMGDEDPCDLFLEGQELGLLLRTDFTNEDAWQSFCTKLQESENEFAAAMKTDDTEMKEGPSSDQAATLEDTETPDADSDSESSTDGIPYPIIKILNPSSPEHQAIFNNVSNLSALRLLNDIDIRPSLSPPRGEKRVDPPNRLIDQDGWQEIYSGSNIWIYDAVSNTDQCVRLVGQEGGGIYGTATGDSWRARGTHICELQFNMSFLEMKIDFGGLDRWDYSERRRNLDEANVPIA